MAESPLNSALRQFEVVEANLAKAEKVLAEIDGLIPTGIAFGDDPSYEDACRAFEALHKALPAIDGWKPEMLLFELDQIAQYRLDAQELGEFDAQMPVERSITEPSRELREFRNRFDQKRRELIREALIEQMDAVDACLRTLAQQLTVEQGSNEHLAHEEFDQLKEAIAQIGMLLGSSIPKPLRWGDLHRHLHFGMVGDLHDIINHDWPSVKVGLRGSLYGENEPIPVEVQDLGALVSAKPKGLVATKLKWSDFSDEDFERLVFALISSEKGYENPEWLTKTNAPDRGRDLSVTRVQVDPLTGTTRQRVILQCKHWLVKSVGLPDVAGLKAQMTLWHPPHVDQCIVVTSGRFTTDAIAFIEAHNQSDTALRILMWPESTLERLLASRPAIIAEFRLR